MGLTHVTVRVGNPAQDGVTENVRCLVDSGAVYSLVPRAVLDRLAIAPHSEREFVLANGNVVRRRLATATFEYDGRHGDSMVTSARRATIRCWARRRSKDLGWCSIRSAASCGRCRCR
jgi:predicted aspartyl protease